MLNSKRATATSMHHADGLATSILTYLADNNWYRTADLITLVTNTQLNRSYLISCL